MTECMEQSGRVCQGRLDPIGAAERDSFKGHRTLSIVRICHCPGVESELRAGAPRLPSVCLMFEVDEQSEAGAKLLPMLCRAIGADPRRSAARVERGDRIEVKGDLRVHAG